MAVELINQAMTVYTLPKDGDDARAVFLELLHSPGETWIADYGFTEADLCREIETADQNGIIVHLLLDRSQAAGSTERKVLADLIAQLKQSDVTITTAGPLSKSPSQIMHSKAMVVRATDGGEDWCWFGSVNFSESGWLQANVAARLRSNAWADDFRAFFETTRAWAREKVPQIQGAIAP